MTERNIDAPAPLSTCSSDACAKPLYGVVAYCPFCGSKQRILAKSSPPEHGGRMSPAAAEAGTHRLVHRDGVLQPVDRDATPGGEDPINPLPDARRGLKEQPEPAPVAQPVIQETPVKDPTPQAPPD